VITLQCPFSLRVEQDWYQMSPWEFHTSKSDDNKYSLVKSKLPIWWAAIYSTPIINLTKPGVTLQDTKYRHGTHTHIDHQPNQSGGHTAIYITPNIDMGHARTQIINRTSPGITLQYTQYKNIDMGHAHTRKSSVGQGTSRDARQICLTSRDVVVVFSTLTCLYCV
jgi:hypothetical protein